MLSVEAYERMISNVPYNLFKVLIVNRSNLEMSREGPEGKVTLCPFFFLLVSLPVGQHLFISLSSIDLTRAFLLSNPPPLSAFTSIIQTGQAERNYFLPSSLITSGFLCLVARRIARFDCSVRLFSECRNCALVN